MADVLRVTTSVNTSTPAPLKPGASGATNQVDKVGHATTGQVGTNLPEIKSPIYDSGSVFQTFATRVSETPDLTETLQKLLIGAMSENAELAAAEGENAIPSLLGELAGKLNMSEADILQNILFQKDQSTSFGSEIFNVLREIAQENYSAETTNYIGSFLKALDSNNNATQTMKGIITQLNNILDRIPRSYAEGIRNAMGELIMEPDSQGLQDNLKHLKETILPMLGRYVSTTNDLGATRDRIQLLIQDISRLNIGGQDEVNERFAELLDYAKYSLNLPADKLNELQNLFNKAVNSKVDLQNDFIDSLAKALTQTKGLSTTSQAMINDTVNALLLNRSVYMPFNHIVLPFTFDGNFMFTEMWVEKDGHSAGGVAGEDKTKRVYLNFDVQGLGKVQAAIGLTDNSIDCLLNCPDTVADKSKTIENDIAKIFTENGFSIGNIKSSGDSFQTELEVLHKIYEGRSSINVTV